MNINTAMHIEGTKPYQYKMCLIITLPKSLDITIANPIITATPINAIIFIAARAIPMIFKTRYVRVAFLL